mmetsp:Transcript_5527/g.16499  ORF Transcript_5527/g.16499 Transcript_5527/m.16499 type:complete len:243 (-) Transcript_5527:349-1077(-)
MFEAQKVLNLMHRLCRMVQVVLIEDLQSTLVLAQDGVKPPVESLIYVVRSLHLAVYVVRVDLERARVGLIAVPLLALSEASKVTLIVEVVVGIAADSPFEQVGSVHEHDARVVSAEQFFPLGRESQDTPSVIFEQPHLASFLCLVVAFVHSDLLLCKVGIKLCQWFEVVPRGEVADILVGGKLCDQSRAATVGDHEHEGAFGSAVVLLCTLWDAGRQNGGRVAVRQRDVLVRQHLRSAASDK